MQAIADTGLIIGMAMIALGGVGVIKSFIFSVAQTDPTDEAFADEN